MIYSIRNKVQDLYRQINQYLPSKEQLKKAAKVTTVSLTTFALIKTALYYYLFGSIERDCMEPIPSFPWAYRVECFSDISEQIHKDGLLRTMANSGKWCKEIFMIILLGGCHKCPKVWPWYIKLQADGLFGFTMLKVWFFKKNYKP